MKQNFRNSTNETNRIVGQFTPEKKKTVLAVCLVILMAFMWIKVFVRKKPATANAMESLEQGGKAHGLSDEKIDEMVKKINELI